LHNIQKASKLYASEASLQTPVGSSVLPRLPPIPLGFKLWPFAAEGPNLLLN